MAQQKNIWKFNDNEWKVHIEHKELFDKLIQKFDLERSTIYYENCVLSEETSWDVLVPNNLITKVKRLLKETT